MSRAQLLRLPCLVLAICTALSAAFISPTVAVYLIKLLIIFAACCWAADLLFGHTVWIGLFNLLLASPLVILGAVFLRSPYMPGFLILIAIIASGDMMMLSRTANSQHLHVRFDYRLATVELLGVGMKRLVAAGVTLKLPRMVSVTLMAWVIGVGLVVAFQAFKMHMVL